MWDCGIWWAANRQRLEHTLLYCVRSITITRALRADYLTWHSCMRARLIYPPIMSRFLLRFNLLGVITGWRAWPSVIRVLSIPLGTGHFLLEQGHLNSKTNLTIGAHIGPASVWMEIDWNEERMGNNCDARLAKRKLWNMFEHFKSFNDTWLLYTMHISLIAWWYTICSTAPFRLCFFKSYTGCSRFIVLLDGITL